MSCPSILITNDPLKGRGQGHVTKFKFWGPYEISGMVTINVTLRLY